AQGRLARAVLTDERVNRASLDRQVDAVQCPNAGKALAQLPDLNDRRAHSRAALPIEIICPSWLERNTASTRSTALAPSTKELSPPGVVAPLRLAWIASTK